MKTDLEILEYVNSLVQSGNAPDIEALRPFIGESTDQRLHALVQNQYLKCSRPWFEDRPAVYTLAAKGENLLAVHQQEVEKLAKQVADGDAEKQAVAAKEKRKSRAEWSRFWLGLLLGWILGAFTPLDALGFVSKVFRWMIALFH